MSIMDEWTADGVRLILGDAREVLPELESESIGAVVMDPPYGISHVSNRPKAMRSIPIYGDSDTGLRDAVLAYCNCPAIVFGTWKQPRPSNTRGVLIWDKGGAVGMGDLSFPWKPSFEEIYVIGKGFSGSRGGAVLRHVVNAQASGGVNGDGWMHPHEKPISLLVELIEKVEADSVLDPFMGSGTTGAACVRLGRRFVGIEIEPAYFDKAKKRIQAELKRTVLFDAPTKLTQRTILD